MRTNPSEQSYPIETNISTPSQVEIGKVVNALNELLTLAWAKKDTIIIADASKLRANLAQMENEWRTQVEYWIYYLIHSQIELIEAQNKAFSTQILARVA